jgi:hypothetical protein
VTWGEKKKVTKYYRVLFRKMMDAPMVRTLIPTIMPKQAAHIDGGFSIAFKDSVHTPLLSGLAATVPYDFFIKATDKSNFRNELARHLPYPEENDQLIAVRSLLLNCLTTHYADLWAECWDDAFTGDAWTKDDPRLNADTDFADLTDTWDWDTPLRTRFARRQALVELDVLAAKALGLTLDELQTIYRVQFPVLRKYEQNTFYDRNGRIIYTKNRGLTGVGFKTKKWREVKDMESGTVEQVIQDDTQPGGVQERTIVYQAPFDKCDREADYATAWDAFEERGM